MTLAIRTNGSAAANIIKAQWFNDIRDLFTGAMNDQTITFQTNLYLVALGSAPIAGMSGVAQAGTVLGIGVYKYAVSFVTSDGGETLPSPQLSVTTTAGNQQVGLSNIPVGPSGTTKR